MRRRLHVAALVAALVLGMSGAARAGFHMHGDGSGVHVDFLGIMESSPNGPDPVFGTPNVDLDTLVFMQPEFASSSSGIFADITTGTLSFRVQSRDGLPIQLISITETGSFDLSDGGGPETQAHVSGLMTAIVTHLADGTALAVPIILSDQLGVTGGGLWDDTSGPSNGSWIGTFLVDIASQVPGAGTIIVNLNNVLQTSSGEGTSSSVQKDSVRIEVRVPGPDPVPEPRLPALLLVLVLTGILLGRAWQASERPALKAERARRR